MLLDVTIFFIAARVSYGWIFRSNLAENKIPHMLARVAVHWIV